MTDDTLTDPTVTNDQPSWLSRLGTAFGNPLVQGLMGMSAGFGQAAMPSPVRIPFGAAIGSGMGGFSQGISNAANLQRAQAQAQQAQMQNQIVAAQMPMMMGQAKLQNQIFQQLNQPGGMQRLMQQLGGGGGPMDAAPTGGSAPATYGALLPALDRDKSQTAGMQANNPLNLMYANQPGASGTLSLGAGRTLAAFPSMPQGVASNVNQMLINQQRYGANTVRSMATRWVSDPDADLTGGEQNVAGQPVKPGSYIGDIASKLNVGPDQPVDFSNPQIASGYIQAAYPHESAGGKTTLSPDDVNAGVQMALGGQQRPYQIAQAGAGMQPPPTGGGTGMTAGPGGVQVQPGMSGPAAVAMPQGVAMTPQAALAQYQNLMRAATFGDITKMPIFGDPQMLRQTANTFLQYGLAPSQEAMKAAAAANVQLQTAGPIAAAQAAARTANTIQSDRFGNMYLGGQYLGRGSEVRPVWDPQKGQMVYGDVGGIGIGALPGQSASPQAEAPPPTTEHFMTERGHDLAEQFNQIDAQAAAAKEGNYLFDNLRNDSQAWQMGKFANWEGDARAWLSAAGHSFGLPDSVMAGLDKPLSDYQSFLKSSGSLLRTAVHETSSRAAVQEYNLIGETLPQPTTSAGAFSQIADQWQALNDFRLAKQQFAKGYLNHPNDFNTDWNGQVSPVSFLINRMSQSPQGQQDMQAMFANMGKTAEGRQQISHIQQQYRYARDAGLFSNLPPTQMAAGVGGG